MKWRNIRVNFVIVVAWIFFINATELQGQLEIHDPANLPVAPTNSCEACNVYNVNDEEVMLALLKSATALYHLCKDTGTNQWEHPANLHNCTKGQFHIFNRWGDFATWLYMDFDPPEYKNLKVGLLYWGSTDPFKLDMDPDPVLP